jgi:hypothetical protein
LIVQSWIWSGGCRLFVLQFIHALQNVKQAKT